LSGTLKQKAGSSAIVVRAHFSSEERPPADLQSEGVVKEKAQNSQEKSRSAQHQKKKKYQSGCRKGQGEM